MDISLADIEDLFPRPLDPEEELRAEALIVAAGELIDEEFLRAGKSFPSAYAASRLLQLTVKRVVREMVFEAIHVGEDVGRASASSATGPQSDSISWAQGVGIHWGGVHMSDRWRRDLGLASVGSLISSPVPKLYAEPVAYRVSASDRAEGARRRHEDRW